MERRYWLSAAAIVTAVLLFLAWDPRGPTTTEQVPATRATVVELGTEAEPELITTIQLEAATREDSGPGGAGSDLIARFEWERADATWARGATARGTALLELPLTAHGGNITRMECRATACRVTIEFTQPADRAEGVAAVLEILRTAGVPALLERADRNRATLLFAP